MIRIFGIFLFSVMCGVVNSMSSECILFKNLTSKLLTLEPQNAKLYRLDSFTGVYRELKSSTVGSGESVRYMLSFAKENVVGKRLIVIRKTCMFFKRLLSAILLKREGLTTETSISQNNMHCRLYTDGQGDNVMVFSDSDENILNFIREELTDAGMGARFYLSE